MRTADHQGAAEDDRPGDQPRSFPGLKNHLEETRQQIERLDQVFKKSRPEAVRKPTVPPIDGLINGIRRDLR